MADRLLNAEDSRDYSHNPGSEHMIKEMQAGREELWKQRGIDYNTNIDWQDVMTNFQDELETQKIKQKRQEDVYKQDRLSKRKLYQG